MMELTINRIEVIEKLKRRHDIVDNLQDQLLEDIVEDTINHYLAIADGVAGIRVGSVPASHSFIITDVASKRYIRRGSEGLKLERVDQYQAQYEEPEKDFSEYMSMIITMYEPDGEDTSRGRVVFY